MLTVGIAPLPVFIFTMMGLFLPRSRTTTDRWHMPNTPSFTPILHDNSQSTSLQYFSTEFFCSRQGCSASCNDILNTGASCSTAFPAQQAFHSIILPPSPSSRTGLLESLTSFHDLSNL
ncbi:hypothetical protein DFH29DRAFT_210323 [Suillus ampliporus]|nr:hypothetical protein DFH29DRAFT_210323 [Suillus ampliporus]